MKKLSKKTIQEIIVYVTAAVLLVAAMLILSGCGSIDESGFSEAGGASGQNTLFDSSVAAGTGGSESGQGFGGQGEGGQVEANSGQDAGATGGTVSQPDGSMLAPDASIPDSANQPSEPGPDASSRDWEVGQSEYEGFSICWEKDPVTGIEDVISKDGTICNGIPRENTSHVGGTEMLGRCWDGLCCNAGCWDGEACIDEPTPDDTIFRWLGKPCEDVM